jgi:hypothetical protein
MSLGPAFVQSRDFKRCAGSGQAAEAWGRKFHESTTHSGHEVLRHSLFACQVRKNTNQTMPRIRTAKAVETPEAPEPKVPVRLGAPRLAFRQFGPLDLSLPFTFHSLRSPGGRGGAGLGNAPP